jgi:drug/metabolite transporter (DMT)-like permease
MALHFWAIHSATVTPKRTEAPSAVVAACASATLCWLLSAGVYIAAKWVAAEMPPWTLCFWRVAIAGLILLPFVRHAYEPMAQLVRARGWELLVIGGLGLSITQGLIYTGLNYTTAINSGLIIALMPMITMVLARFILHEPMGAWQAVGSAIAFAGMAVIIVRGDLEALLRLDFNLGELWVVLAAVCFALYTVLLRRARFALQSLPLLVILLGGGTLAALPFYAWELLHDERTALNASGLLALAYTAIPGGALMYYFYNRSVEVLGAAKAGVFLYLQPIFIAGLAYVLLDERLGAYHLAGAALILLGVLLVTLIKPHGPAPSSGPAGQASG